MASTLPFNSTCCDTCDDTLTVNIPGEAGGDGTPGADGADGENAYTTLSAAFTQPAVGANVTASVTSSAWIVVGQAVYVGTGGYYTAISKPSTAQVVLRNRGDTDNAAPAAAIPSGSGVGPAGTQGTAAAGANEIGDEFFLYDGKAYITVAGLYHRVYPVLLEGVISMDVEPTPTTLP